MLQCVSHVKLPSTPQQVALHHHVLGGVAIMAVAYAKSATGPNYFTVAELPTPNVDGAPMRITHVRAPGQHISRLAIARSPDGADVFIVAQCYAVRPADGAATDVKVCLFRREATLEEDGDCASEAVRYRRMPHPVRGLAGDEAAAVGELAWTATLALNSADNVVGVAAGTAGEPASGARVVVAAGGGSSAQPVCLQALTVAGTRGAVDYAVQLPALSGFTVEELLAVPGCADRIILRCHHALVEVDMRLCERLVMCQEGGGGAPAQALVRTNDAITRVWRWTPRDRLTAACVKDAHVYATTEEGVVLLWDYAQGSRGEGASLSTQQCPVCHSKATGVAHTGIYAPYATDFVTCGVDGSVLSWGYSRLADALEAGVVGLGALSDFAQAAADAAVEKAFPYTPSPADGSRAVPYLPQTLLKAYALDSGDGYRSVAVDSTGLMRYMGTASSSSGATTRRDKRAEASQQAAMWLGKQIHGTRDLVGTAGESCIGLSGDGNLVSVIGDLSTLRLYLCQ